ncbi:DUF4350 domain-containing protein [Pedobacter rhizosphaerae]|uniref:DUF4350 domain-containing protein n=1 Tax=Pedobacter rhizosphaerae TaxID=390241 RepID=A0A1H9LNZ7_9SPHI|nr:DUF4350 domain-containing protein [Pedobacter rhizosphaerae]SER12865.1 hypothetical protein SAMN04488023_104221 [Pedobacter rhizosphaerae]
MSGLKKYFIISAVLLVLYLVAQYFKPKATNWAPSYLTEDKIPFGTYILHQRIKDVFPDVKIQKSKHPIYNTIKESPATGVNYLIIASKVKADKLDYKELIKFIERGNHVFIAAFGADHELLKGLKLTISSDFGINNKNKTTINFKNPSLKADKNYNFDRGISRQYFSKIDTAKATVLGTNDSGKANFIQYNFGKGSLFILPNPQLFTNYSLLKPAGSDYVSKALSYLPKGKYLIWDEHFTRPSTVDTSPLRLVFKYDQLRWAYLLSLFGLLAFVLFEIKRRQRVIPVISRPTNTSVEFVKTVGRVYYQQRNNKDIAQKKVNYFLEYIRNKYRMRTLNLDEEFKLHLSRVSGASAETVNQLSITISKLQNLQVWSDDDLIALNKTIEQFYKEDQ